VTKEIAVGIDRRRETVGHSNSEAAEFSQHFAERRVLATHELDVRTLEIAQR
jgi:hypothetical protein